MAEQRITGPNSQTSYLVEATYRDAKHGSTTYRVVGGSKPYIRLWDTGEQEWTWVLSPQSRPVP